MYEDDFTQTIGFERAVDNVIQLWPNQCPKCMSIMGVVGRKSAAIKVVTSNGNEIWCQQCYENGLKENICIKEVKISKKERRKLKND
jgi:hypothetical protein